MILMEVGAIQNDKANLTNASFELREILYFCLNPHYNIDLPDFEPDAFGEIAAPQNPPMQILKQEGPKFLHLFVKDFNPNLTRSRRIQLLKDILRFATQAERIFLFQVMNRKIPGISRGDCVRAFGEQFFEPRTSAFQPVAAPVVAKPKPASNKKTVEAFRPVKSIGIPQL
jgi:hypothetical protein